MLPYGLKIMEAWGFAYETNIILAQDSERRRA